MSKIYVAARCTGDFICEADSIQRAKKIIANYEELDKAFGDYTEDWYDIVDENHMTIADTEDDVEVKTIWTDYLDHNTYMRLASCRSLRRDILPLAQAKWNVMKSCGNFEPEDALIWVLELLDSNNCSCADVTENEYKEILSKIV